MLLPARWFRLLPLLFAFATCAQDAGMVLRTSVDYNTRKATLSLSAEQRSEADRLGREAQQQSRAGRYGEALRSYYQGLAVMRGQEWTPAMELASSLQAKLDHALIEPDAETAVSLAPLYPCEREAKLTASALLRPAAKDATPGRTLAAGESVDPARLPLTLRAKLTGVTAGNYFLEVRLAPAEVVRRLPVRVDSLAAEATRLRQRLGSGAPAAPTAEYALALYERVDQGDGSPHRYDLRREFEAAHRILDALEKGRDPFAARRGDMRKAYRSAVDQTLQPYRLFVPARYASDQPAPLVVALHGMGGDENSMFDSYDSGALKREAERRGFFVVCPKGRDSASMYRGAAERDVLDVIAEVRRDYRIDPRRLYLMGHSMGGFGTWSIAMNHPDLFAALGPIAGGGNPAGMDKIRHIPQYVVHGDNDKTVAVGMSRVMVEAAKKAGVKLVYVEVPGGGHVDIARPQFGPMLDFFGAQSHP